MRRVTTLAAAGAVAMLTLAACGEAPPEETDDAPAAEGGSETSGPADGSGADGSEFKACMVSDAGGFDDQSFNQAAASGLESAEENFGVEGVLQESSSDADYGPNMTAMVQQDCDIVIGVGYLLEQAVQDAAGANEGVDFALVDSAFSDDSGEPVELDNGKPILFNTGEAAFLAGYLAAGMSETGTIATFGGIPIPSVQIFMDGYWDGVERYNEDNGTDVQLLGWDKEAQQGSFSGDFDDQAQGSALTEGFVAQDADIILPVAGPVGLGAASVAAENEGVRLIWVDSDGYETTDYGDIILTSVLKDMGPAVEGAIEDTVSGGFTNEPYVGTLADGGVSLAPYHDFEDEIPQELKDQIADYTEQISSGELVIESDNAP